MRRDRERIALAALNGNAENFFCLLRNQPPWHKYFSLSDFHINGLQQNSMLATGLSNVHGNTVGTGNYVTRLYF